MVVPGYDIDDLDENLRERLVEWALKELLSDEEQEQLRQGASLLDLLDEEDIDRITEGERLRR